MRRSVVFLSIFATLCFASARARADESNVANANAANVNAANASDPNDEATFARWHIGLTPMLGAGVAKLGAGNDFPKFVGMSVAGVELQASLARLGGFVRFNYLSSGSDGRWTAPAFTLGGSYRIHGDGWDHVGIVLRGGFAFERWHASTAGCAVNLVIPTNCKDIQPPLGSGLNIPQAPPAIQVTTDLAGIAPGVRIEMPLQQVYVAFDADLVALAPLESQAPGAVFEARFSVVFGLRNRRAGATVDMSPEQDPRRRRGVYY